ncbi:MliC family protein [Sphingomonas sp. SUN019]|uniref:MliC family protein n=1 Tax=Sphingomonas sp. SUN019 TaxID=2937788 RepID=UPI00216424A1|nr:MliC family protein [Sphingomonas sp. SUN019]UVO51523.1 MliC family protein [Sphingomonas sp. SUN019]
MRSFLVSCALPLIAIGGCSRESDVSNEVDIATAADAARGSVDNYAALPDEAPPRPQPAATKPAAPAFGEVTTAADAEGVEAAAAVVCHYYALIGAGRYPQAWRLWDDDGRASEMSQQAFAASFDKYAEYRAEVGAPGRIDAGAGQRYVTVPIRISGRLKEGDRPFAMEGPVTLHRTAEIDGASPEQRRWRISSSGVRPRRGEATPAPDPETPDRVTTRYRCDDGTAFTAVFDNRADAVTLRFGAGEVVRLPSERPASGIWYRNSRYELRGKGRNATLTRGRAMPVDCTAAQ